MSPFSVRGLYRTAVATVALALGAAWGVATETTAFHWSRQVESPQIDKPTLLAVPLDSQIFAATLPGFADMRLHTKSGEPVAFVVRGTPTTKKRTIHRTWTARQRSAKPLESGGLEIVLELDKQSPSPQALSIVSPLHDFEHQVTVFSSADGADWAPAGPPAVVFDYSRFIDVRNIMIPVHAQGQRHFRLVIDDVTTEQASRLLELTRRLQGPNEVERSERTTIDRRPFRVDRIEFHRDDVETQATGVQVVAYPTHGFHVREDAEKKQTLIEFSTEREPLTGLKLVTDSTNFSRTASLEIPESNKGDIVWRTRGSAILSRFSFEAIDKHDLAITFPEQRSQRYRVVIENRDSPPLKVTDVAVEGPAYQVVFLGTPGEQLTFDYGASEAPNSNYDTAAVQKFLSAGYIPAQVRLADAVENVVEAAPPRRWSWLEDSRVIVGVIAGLTALLGWGLYRASRRLENITPQ